MPQRFSTGARFLLPSVNYIVAVSLFWRLFLAIADLNPIHPDQSFQYYEQAHRLAFGFGYIPWEYRFGLRNWLLPGTLAGVLRGLEVAGFDQPAFYVPFMRALAAVLSVSAIYAVNAIGRNLYGPACGLTAALFVGFWHELDGYAVALIPEVLGMYAILIALAIVTGEQTARRALALGLILVFAVALRIQLLPVVAVIAGAFVMNWKKQYRPVAAISAAVMAMACGFLDYIFWGSPFISYYNNIYMNIGLDIAGTFGKKPIYYYFVTLSLFSAFLFALSGLYGLLTWRRSALLLAVLAAVLIPHSLIAHKERRFIIVATPLLLLLAADAILRLRALVFLRARVPSAPMLAISAVLLLTVATSHFRNAVDRDGRLDSMVFLSQRPGVSGVLDMSSGDWEFGGYYYLHRDVPLLTRGNATPVMLAEPARYFSHVIDHAEKAAGAGYQRVAQFGNFAVYEQITKVLNNDSPQPGYRNKLNKNVDGRYTPNVKPWPPL